MTKEYLKGDIAILASAMNKLKMSAPELSTALGYSDNYVKSCLDKNECSKVAEVAANGLICRAEIGIQKVYFMVSIADEGQIKGFEAFCRHIGATVHSTITL